MTQFVCYVSCQVLISRILSLIADRLPLAWWCYVYIYCHRVKIISPPCYLLTSDKKPAKTINPFADYRNAPSIAFDSQMALILDPLNMLSIRLRHLFCVTQRHLIFFPSTSFACSFYVYTKTEMKKLPIIVSMKKFSI